MPAAKSAVSAEQVQRAVAALLKFCGKQRDSANDLLDEDDFLHLVIALKRTPQGPRRDKPIRLPIPHPLYSLDGADICLFVKDHKGEGHKAAKERVRSERTAGVSKIVGLSKLRTKYESAEAKRELCRAFDLFMADSRVLPSLPKLIGKSFFKKKKQPLPVDLRKGDWGAQIRAAAEATYLYPSTGSCINIRVARSSMPERECVANVLAAIDAAVQHVPHKWRGVRALHLKATNSVALPVYQSAPEALPVSELEETRRAKALAARWDAGDREDAGAKAEPGAAVVEGAQQAVVAVAQAEPAAVKVKKGKGKGESKGVSKGAKKGGGAKKRLAASVVPAS